MKLCRRYRLEVKLKAVKAYLDNEGSYGVLVKRYGISGRAVLQRWVKTYQAFGEKGLITSRENREHSFEFKLHVVESYLTTDISYQDLALSVGLTNSRAIKEWVAVFREAGPEALRQRQEGRPNEVARKRKAIPTEQDKKSEYVKQLEHELLYAKIENAYLKGLRRLRLKEAKWKKGRETSTASEDHTD